MRSDVVTREMNIGAGSMEGELKGSISTRVLSNDQGAGQ